MALPADVRDTAIDRIERYCALRNEQAGGVRLEHEVRGSSITLVERRAPWRGGGDWTSMPIAQLRFADGCWSLHWQRHTGRWERYGEVDQAADVALLLAEVDADPDGVFWG